MIRRHPSRLALPLVLAGLLLAGCSLVTITLLIDLDVTGSYASSSSNVAAITVDLTKEKDFRDNRDKIQSVDEVGFIFRAVNHTNEEAKAEVWLSLTPLPETTAESIRSGARRVLSGLQLPANGTVDLNYEGSLVLEENRELLHQAILGGRFVLYGIASTSNFDLTIDKLTVGVVLTAGQ